MTLPEEITAWIAFATMAFPYVTVMLNKVHNSRIKKIQDAANRITSALEETNLDGIAKKQLGKEKLAQITKTMPFFNLTDDQFSDFIDAAVNDMRAAGNKDPKVQLPPVPEEVEEEK